MAICMQTWFECLRREPRFREDMKELQDCWGDWMEANGIEPYALFEAIVVRLTALGYPTSGEPPPPEVMAVVIHAIVSETMKRHRDKAGTR